jgi:C_GCAxxG_C_C family probable redox protein
MARADDAVDSFKRGFSCSQAVFSSFSEDLGLDHDAALKIACGLRAGIGRTGNICGAVSGAVLAIGLKYGKARPEDNDARDRTYVLVQQFMQEYVALHGSVNCTDLMGYDLSVPEQHEAASRKRLFATRCPGLIRDAAMILETVL